ncbi:MAG: hypothetical protein JRN15_12885 [Nitrososphaerota archaeon]|nr:hypothetical protein [Nitrososphaerota archaeon]
MSATDESVAEKTKDLSLEEIAAGYSGRWVAMTVTKRDDNLQPTRGIVVAHDVDRYKLRTNITKYTDICILYAGDPPFRLMF